MAIVNGATMNHTECSILDFEAGGVVIDAGVFPQNSIPLSWLGRGLPVVCCDGAANRYVRTGYDLWRIVGDCDSLSDDVMRRYGEIVRRNPDQNTNDQTKAIQYLSREGINKIVVLGATGMREDHTLGNISLLPEYLRSGIQVRAYTDYGVFIPVRDEATFHCRPGSQVSIFNFGSTGMRSEGLKYPLRHFDALWQGTLNEAVSGEFAVYARGEYMVFINY